MFARVLLSVRVRALSCVSRVGCARVCVYVCALSVVCVRHMFFIAVCVRALVYCAFYRFWQSVIVCLKLVHCGLVGVFIYYQVSQNSLVSFCVLLNHIYLPYTVYFVRVICL